MCVYLQLNGMGVNSGRSGRHCGGSSTSCSPSYHYLSSGVTLSGRWQYPGRLATEIRDGGSLASTGSVVAHKGGAELGRLPRLLHCPDYVVETV
jgi:hypothetical protein